MNIKKSVKNIVAQNTYVNNLFYKVLAKRNASKMTSIMHETGSFDCIRDISRLREFRSRVSGGEIFSNKDANLSDARVYGIWKSLFPLVSENDAHFTPCVEHGLILHDRIFPDVAHSGRCTAVTMSPWRASIVRKYFKGPVFCCGPYIQYADYWYSNADMMMLKKQLGKTLLVFPCHSTDSSNLTMNNKRYLNMVRELAQDFDTVLVNSFWWNVNDSIMEDFEKASYKIVSAGFRDDPNFMKRLKTIISLADFVVGDSVGTHIGYCIALNKPFCLFDAGTKEDLLSPGETKDKPFRDSCIKEISHAFLGATSIGERQVEIAAKYWGYGIRLSQAELDAICEFSRELTAKTHGFISQAIDVAWDMVRQEQSHKEVSPIVKESIGYHQ